MSVATVTGIIGAITGFVGLVVSCLAFRRTYQIKALELRLELRRVESTLQGDIRDLIPLLDTAKLSRTRLAAAQLCYRSGHTTHWLSEWDTDLVEAQALVAESSALDVDCSHLSQPALESRIVTVHRLQLQVSKLVNKYRDALAEDDKGRDKLHEDQRMITQARLTLKSD